MAFDKSAFFAATKPKVEQVNVDGFGAVNLAQLNVADVDALRKSLNASNESDKFGLRMLLLSVVDDDGARVFGDDDLPSLEAASNSAIEALVGKTLEVNGFRKAADAKN